MIAHALEFVRKTVEKNLGLANGEVLLDSARKLGKDENAGAVVSLINMQEENALRNTPHVERRNGLSHYVEPPVHLNLYLLFAFDFPNYGTSLAHLSDTVELFQGRRWFSAENSTPDNPFPPGLEKLVVEFVNLGFEELNNLWGVLGGTYLPSAICKLRLVKIQGGAAVEAPEITTLGIEVLAQ